MIKEMTKTAGVHRDIKEIEWRFLVVEMATKDLKKVRHDVGCFKVIYIWNLFTPFSKLNASVVS